MKGLTRLIWTLLFVSVPLSGLAAPRQLPSVQQQVIWDDGENTCGNPCPVADEQTGAIWLLMTQNHGDDHGSAIKKNAGYFIPARQPTPAWQLCLTVTLPVSTRPAKNIPMKKLFLPASAWTG